VGCFPRRPKPKQNGEAGIQNGGTVMMSACTELGCTSLTRRGAASSAETRCRRLAGAATRAMRADVAPRRCEHTLHRGPHGLASVSDLARPAGRSDAQFLRSTADPLHSCPSMRSCAGTRCRLVERAASRRPVVARCAQLSRASCNRTEFAAGEAPVRRHPPGTEAGRACAIEPCGPCVECAIATISGRRRIPR